MKKIFLLIVIGISTFSLNAQQAQADLDYLKSSRKEIKIGTALTIAGAGTAIVGTLMFVNGTRTYPSTPGHITKDTYTSTEGIIGYVLMPAGVILIGIGIPVLIAGCLHKSRAQRNLQMSLVNITTPINCASINGIRLSIRF
jgi:uncharacterized membrane protein YidH (DUF202 family)